MPRHFTDTEVQLLLKTARGTLYYPYWVVALDTGARQGELFALTWDDWNPATGELSITKSIDWDDGWKRRVKDLKTPASRRKIVLSEIFRESPSQVAQVAVQLVSGLMHQPVQMQRLRSRDLHSPMRRKGWLRLERPGRSVGFRTRLR